MPGAATVVLTPAAPLDTLKAPAPDTVVDDAPFRVADLVDKFIGPYESDSHMNSPLKVLDAGFK